MQATECYFLEKVIFVACPVATCSWLGRFGRNCRFPMVRFGLFGILLLVTLSETCETVLVWSLLQATSDETAH
jgi:hypothetical protein